MSKNTITRSQISVLHMSINPPECVVNAGYKVILDDKVLRFVGIYWVEEGDATQDDYDKIPVVID